MTDIYVDWVQGGSKGQTIYSETRRILDRLFSLDLHYIEKECNRVANAYRNIWSTKNPNDFMIEYGLEYTTYESGIRELNPPFLLAAPLTVHIQVFDSQIDELYPQYSANSNAAAGVLYGDPMNPKLMIFLPTLEVTNSTITWTHRNRTSFKSVIIHEFLHLCGEVKTPTRDIIDGVIRHTMVGTEAIEPIIPD